MSRCPARDKVNGLPHHKLIIDFFILGSQLLKLRVLRIASVAKTKFRMEVKQHAVRRKLFPVRFFLNDEMYSEYSGSFN